MINYSFAQQCRTQYHPSQERSLLQRRILVNCLHLHAAWGDRPSASKSSADSGERLGGYGGRLDARLSPGAARSKMPLGDRFSSKDFPRFRRLQRVPGGARDSASSSASRAGRVAPHARGAEASRRDSTPPSSNQRTRETGRWQSGDGGLLGEGAYDRSKPRSHNGAGLNVKLS